MSAIRGVMLLHATVALVASTSLPEDDAVCLLQRGATQLRSTAISAQSEPAAVHARSLCGDGKLLPELYVLGAQKAATTSFAYDLMHAGILSAAGSTRKEWHFFDLKSDDFADVLDSSLEDSETAPSFGHGRLDLYRQLWEEELPDCPTGATKQVLADMTPRNLRLTPLPPGVLPSESWPRDSGNALKVGDVPRVLRSFYGAKSHRVTLVVMLREPGARMLSSWFDDDCRSCRTMEAAGWTFEKSVERSLAEAQQSPPIYADSLWANMYGSQLERYLEHWQADQLIVIPYLQYVKLNKAAIFEHLSARLGVSLAYNGSIPYMWISQVKNGIVTSTNSTVASRWNSDPHPTIEDTLSPQARQKLDAVMAADKRKLLNVLANARRQGAWLAGFGGTTDSEIETWLDDSW